MRQQSYFRSGGCRRHDREGLRGAEAAGTFPRSPWLFRVTPPLSFRVSPLCSRCDPELNFPFVSFCSTCVLQICSMDVLQRNNKTKQQ